MNLLISDVPADDPAFIGSGPFATPPDAKLPVGLPDWVNALLTKTNREARQPEATAVNHHIIASNRDACAAVADDARKKGLAVYISPVLLEGEVGYEVDKLFDELENLPPGLHVFGGETTVALPETLGCGGRNQHLALAAAIHMAGRSDLWLLAAGTDGTDGPTQEAGALVDGGTVARGEASGLDALDCLHAPMPALFCKPVVT